MRPHVFRAAPSLQALRCDCSVSALGTVEMLQKHYLRDRDPARLFSGPSRTSDAAGPLPSPMSCTANPRKDQHANDR